MSYKFLPWTKKDRLLFTTQAAYAAKALFHENAAPALDLAVYRVAYPQWDQETKSIRFALIELRDVL